MERPPQKMQMIAPPEAWLFAGTYVGPGLLQQLAGQVLGLTILQRRANGTVLWCNIDDGAFAGNVESQQMIDRTAAGPACALVEDHGDEVGFGSILHHYITRYP